MILFCSWQSLWRPHGRCFWCSFGLCVFGKLERLMVTKNLRGISVNVNLLLMFADFGRDFHQFTDINSRIQRRTSAGHQLVAWSCDIDVTPQASFLMNPKTISAMTHVDFQLDLSWRLSCFLNLTGNSYINGSYPCASPNRFASRHFFGERWWSCLFLTKA